MSGGDGGSSGQEPTEVGELRVLCDQLRRRYAEAALDARGLTRLVGVEEVTAFMAAHEPSARRSVWNLQPRLPFDPEDPGIGLTEQSAARGLDLQLVTRRSTLRIHPLLPSLYPGVLVGPVFAQALVIDERLALVEGPDTVEGTVTAWAADRADLVDAAVEVWHRTLALAEPVLAPGQEPPLTRRQTTVARMLATGHKDAAIARTLKLSQRTVEREVSAVLASLGAHSRTEAVLLMTGRGVNGGRPGRF